ncbi:MAG: LysE family transporter [Burkholderiaceae bacterium]
MKLYPLFLLVAALTVLSPGPGVLMTLTNSLRFGLKGSIGGIVGIASGNALVALISATGLGVLLAHSASAFALIKYLGAAYLVFMGIKLWRAKPFVFDLALAAQHSRADHGRRFLTGLSLALSNPQSIFFFLSVFPQFIEPGANHGLQFALLVGTFGALVIVIHCGYALVAQHARRWLTSPQAGRAVNRVGGTTFIAFGGLLATASR